jgi:hypothetical protein
MRRIKTRKNRKSSWIKDGIIQCGHHAGWKWHIAAFDVVFSIATWIALVGMTIGGTIWVGMVIAMAIR